MTETTTPTLDQLAEQVAALQRKEKGLDEIPTGRTYFEEIARRQATAFLEGRERAHNGLHARQLAEANTQGKRQKIQAHLAGIQKDRASALERHDQARHDLIARFNALEEKPQAELAEIQTQVNQAASEAETEPVNVPTPKIALRIDYSETMKSVSTGGWR
jgi:hypothetical protein